jgi:hypothetical protein
MRFLIGLATGVVLGFAVVAIATGDSGPAAIDRVRARRGGFGASDSGAA